jgi:cyclophilin family peptidyl-prolyl cis-trans isomerase
MAELGGGHQCLDNNISQTWIDVVFSYILPRLNSTDGSEKAACDLVQVVGALVLPHHGMQRDSDYYLLAQPQKRHELLESFARAFFPYREKSDYDEQKLTQVASTAIAHSNFWHGVRIFRIVPNFVSQFGISSYPNEGWSDVETLLDDPPRMNISNTRGTVTFATSGPNTRTTQVFINTANNEYLDNQGFTPIGEVLMAGDGYGGMDVVQEFYSGYGERPDQKKIKTFGEEYLIQEFPLLSYLVSAEVVSN